MQLGSQQEIHILHVDDEPDLADLTQTFLEREDDRFAVEAATSANEGLQHISDRQPDCVVSDFNMPRMDGIEFLQAVREEHPDLPFILFTGKGSEAVASDAIAAGVTDYLQKKSGTEQYELLANRIRNGVESRREAERADRQEQLMRLTEFAGDTGGFEIDVDDGNVLLTDGTRRLIALPNDTHITLEEAIEFYHSDDQADVRQAVTRAAETGKETRGTWRLQTLDGDERLLNVTLTPAIENGDVTTLRGAIHDVTERRKRRRELEQTETLFQHAQDSLFLISVAEAFTIERVNPAWESTTGLSAKRVQGQTPRDVLGEQPGATAEAKYRECIQRREPLQYDETIRFDGQLTHWETRIAPVELNGSVEYIVGATRDVTDRKERERELSRLQQAIDDASVSIALTDPSQPDNPLVYVNNAFEEMTGYPREEMLGRNCRFLQGEDTDSEKSAALREAIDSEEPISVELRNYRKDGTEFWNRLSVTPIYGEDGQLVRYLGTQEDVTERKERERELAQTHDLMANMEQLADVGAWEYDPETKTLALTEGSHRICGLEPGVDLTLEEVFNYFHPEDRERITDRFTECLETGEPYEIDVRLITTEGTQRWVTTRGERVDTSGSDNVVRGYIRDITEERTRERQLTELNQASKGLLTAKTIQEVADIGVEAASDILGLQANGIHISEAGDTRLAPVAQTNKVTSLIGDTQPLPVADSIAGRVYRNGEPAVITDVHQDPDVHNSETDLEGHLYLPLGDHGVLIAGSEKRAAFDQQDLALGKLLAGNLVAALDRIDREQTARQRREQLALFFEESPLGAVQWDNNFNFERVNKRAEEILGYSEAELRGKSWEMIVAEDDRREVGDVVEKLLAAEGGTDMINSNVRKNGEILTCEWHNRVVTNNSGDVQSVFSKFQDVTDRKNREQELLKITNQYQTLVENFPNGAVFMFNDDLRYIRAGGEELEAAGITPDEVEGATAHDIFPEQLADELTRYYNDALEGNTHTFVQTIGDKTYRTWTIPVQLSGEDIDYGMGMSQDITDQIERRQELERQNERLEEFTSIVSHDLRSPLSVANEYLKLAEETSKSDYLERAADALDRSQALIDDLLKLAREGEIVGELEPVDLADVAERSWQTVETGSGTLETHATGTLTADRSRIKELVENLYRNAIDHGGGGVTVSVGAMDGGFYVADTGPGIPKSDRKEVFEAGYSTNEHGTGFGLRIVKQITDAHGWDITVTESEQGGARFEITGVKKSE